MPAFITAECLGALLALLSPAWLFATLPTRPIHDRDDFHNPACGTSRNTLAMIQASGVEPTVVEYLKTPPRRERLEALIAAMGITPRELLREKGTPYATRPRRSFLSDAQLIDAMMAHPILINGRLVETRRGTRLCRPSEVVLDLLDNPPCLPLQGRRRDRRSAAPALSRQRCAAASQTLRQP